MYRVLSKHTTKIQAVTPWPILRIFGLMIICKQPLCFGDVEWIQFAGIIIFYYRKVHLKLLNLRNSIWLPPAWLETLSLIAIECRTPSNTPGSFLIELHQAVIRFRKFSILCTGLAYTNDFWYLHKKKSWELKSVNPVIFVGYYLKIPSNQTKICWGVRRASTTCNSSRKW